VWTDGYLIGAIQFYMDSGRISPLYGTPASDDQQRVFDGTDNGSYIVGIHGRCDFAILSIGFTVVSVDSSLPGTIGGSTFATIDESENGSIQKETTEKAFEISIDASIFKQ
jgi:hypothetical protein